MSASTKAVPASTNTRTAELRAIIKSHKRWDIIFGMAGLAAMSVGVLTLVALFAQMFVEGLPRISAEFFTNFPSRRAATNPARLRYAR